MSRKQNSRFWQTQNDQSRRIQRCHRRLCCWWIVSTWVRPRHKWVSGWLTSRPWEINAAFNFGKANRSQQDLRQGIQTLKRLVDVKPDKFLTEISASEASHCSLIDFTMHWMDGSKNEATLELRKDIVTVVILCRMHTQEVSAGQSECWVWDLYRECRQTWYIESHLRPWTWAW